MTMAESYCTNKTMHVDFFRERNILSSVCGLNVLLNLALHRHKASSHPRRRVLFSITSSKKRSSNSKFSIFLRVLYAA